MMKGIWRRTLLASLLLAAIAGAYAQNPQKNSSVSINIVATVPVMLSLSLDFDQNSTTRVAGYLADDTGLAGTTASGFQIAPGVQVELGGARLFTNLPGSYSIDVYSSNGGSLMSESGDAIPYSLHLGDSSAMARDGAFCFSQNGKSAMTGDSLMVALEIDTVPAAASSGLYTDHLMFSVSAN